MLNEEQERYVRQYVEDLPEGQSFPQRADSVARELAESRGIDQTYTSLGKLLGMTRQEFTILTEQQQGARFTRVMKIANHTQCVPLAMYFDENQPIAVPNSTDLESFYNDTRSIIMPRLSQLSNSRRQQARRCGVSVDRINYFVTGRLVLTQHFEQICRTLGVVQVYLLPKEFAEKKSFQDLGSTSATSQGSSLTTGQDRYVRDFVEDFPEGLPFRDQFKEFRERIGVTYGEMAELLGTLRTNYQNQKAREMRTIHAIAMKTQRIPLMFGYLNGRKPDTFRNPNFVKFQQEIGSALRGEREKLGLSVNEVGNSSKLSYNTIYRTETGHNIGSSSLESICGTLGIVPVYLV